MSQKEITAFMLGRSHVVSGLAGASLILTLTDLSDRPEIAATTVALVAGSAIPSLMSITPAPRFRVLSHQ